MNKPDWQMRRISPQWSVTVSPEAAQFIGELLDDPDAFRSRSEAVDRCIIIARDWCNEQARKEMAKGISSPEL